MIPDVTVHGVWVRSLVHDGFGRLCYKVLNRLEPGSIEFMVMWEPDADLDYRRHTGGYHSPEDLMVRPYKPRPWFKKPIVKEVVYYGDSGLRDGTEMSQVRSARGDHVDDTSEGQQGETLQDPSSQVSEQPMQVV